MLCFLPCGRVSAPFSEKTLSFCNEGDQDNWEVGEVSLRRKGLLGFGSKSVVVIVVVFRGQIKHSTTDPQVLVDLVRISPRPLSCGPVPPTPPGPPHLPSTHSPLPSTCLLLVPSLMSGLTQLFLCVHRTSSVCTAVSAREGHREGAQLGPVRRRVGHCQPQALASYLSLSVWAQHRC